MPAAGSSRTLGRAVDPIRRQKLFGFRFRASERAPSGPHALLGFRLADDSWKAFGAQPWPSGSEQLPVAGDAVVHARDARRPGDEGTAQTGELHVVALVHQQIAADQNLRLSGIRRTRSGTPSVWHCSYPSSRPEQGRPYEGAYQRRRNVVADAITANELRANTVYRLAIRQNVIEFRNARRSSGGLTGHAETRADPWRRIGLPLLRRQRGGGEHRRDEAGRQVGRIGVAVADSRIYCGVTTGIAMNDARLPER